MRGIVIIPNSPTGLVAVQRSDGLILVLKPLENGQLHFLDVVELGDPRVGSEMRLKNYTMDALVDVLVQKMDLYLSWEEKMRLLGRGNKPPKE